jgi:hypothetical protein
MLHKFLEDYLKRIELALLALNQVYVERYTEEILTPTRVNLRLRIRWYSGYLLEINEAVIVVEFAAFGRKPCAPTMALKTFCRGELRSPLNDVG